MADASGSEAGPPPGPPLDLTAEALALSREGAAGRATSVLFERLYDELRSMAGSFMARERPEHTLTPTGLVHEAFLRLVDQSRLDWKDRAHFFGFAAHVMRQVLVDHARRRGALKRGGELTRVSLTDGDASFQMEATDMIALDEAFTALGAEDARAARVAEMRLFGGLTLIEAANVLDVSERTAQGDWAFARRWLSRRLGGS